MRLRRNSLPPQSIGQSTRQSGSLLLTCDASRESIPRKADQDETARVAPSRGFAATDKSRLQQETKSSIMTTNNVLSTRAMLSGLTIRQWTARKLDKRVTAEVAATHGTDSHVGRYNKSLVAKESLAAIVAAANAARALHYARTLPWLDDGARILPAGGIP